MSYASYNELASSLAARIKAPSVVAQLPQLIYAAENDIWHTLRARFMQAVQVEDLVATDQGFNLDAGSYAFAPRGLILLASDGITEYHPSRAPDNYYDLYGEITETGIPEFYAVDFLSSTQAVIFDRVLADSFTAIFSFWRKFAHMAIGEAAASTNILGLAPDLIEARVLSWITGEEQIYWLRQYKEIYRDYNIVAATENRTGRPASYTGEYY